MARVAATFDGRPCVKCGSTTRIKSSKRCYPCHVERARVWYQTNADEYRPQAAAIKRATYAENPEVAVLNNVRTRFVQAGADVRLVTVKDLDGLLRRQGCACYMCRKPLDGYGIIEHLIPLSRGGRHAIGNLALSCRSCNSKKRSRTVSEHRRYLYGRGVVWVPQRLF